MFPLAVTRSSSNGNAMLGTSGFVDDVMFTHNGPRRTAFPSGDDEKKLVSDSSQIWLNNDIGLQQVYSS